MIRDIDVLLDDLQIEMSQSGERLYASCPIHSGDNPTAFSIYLDRDRFYCHTHECHKSTFNSIIGFVRMMLSVQHCGWSSPGDQLYGFAKTLNYIKGLYGIDGEISRAQPGEYRAKPRTNIIRKERILGTREQYFNMNTGTPEYYLKRGFSHEVLEKFDVRHCNLRGNRYFGRVVVPVFDSTDRLLIGLSGRSTNNEEPRWKYTGGFPCGFTLYGYKLATEYIKRRRSVILVESPPDLWRLHESNIYNAVCIWSALGWNDCKKMLLDKLGIVKIILALDNDDAGRAGREKVRRAVGSFYNIVDVQLPDEVKDIGDLSVTKVQSLFKGVI